LSARIDDNITDRSEMADYERITAASIQEVLRTAEAVLTERLPIEKVSEDRHSITLSGGDGTVTITARRVGPDTVVHASTDQLRTSRLDVETQYYLNQLPYQPGDRPTR
jgi:hypothetical protein